MNAQTKIVSYRGYENCYRIVNKTTEVIIAPDAGGRVLRYALNGKNMIFENPKQNGKKLDDYLEERFDPDAGRFDIGPEPVTRLNHENLWMGPYSAEITGDYSVKIKSMEDTVTGMMLEREFILDPKSSYLKVELKMTNISDKQQNYYFWSRTLCNIGGKVIIPLKDNSEYEKGWGVYTGKPWKFQYENVQDELIHNHDDFITVDAKRTGYATKLGVDSDDGWMAYGNEGEYGEPAGQTIVYYSNGNTFIELEPVSDYRELQPGECSEWEENWWLIRYPEAENAGFDAEKAVEFLEDK